MGGRHSVDRNGNQEVGTCEFLRSCQVKYSDDGGPVPDQEPELAGAVTEVQELIAGLLDGSMVRQGWR